MQLNRRELVVSISALASLAVSGCSVFGRSSKLDATIEDLETLLEQITGDNSTKATAIAGEIGRKSRALQDAHSDFSAAFNQKAIDRDVKEGSLTQLVDEYEKSRLAIRNQLLHLQDELHAAVPDDDWPDVLEVLNRKSEAIAPTPGMEG